MSATASPWTARVWKEFHADNLTRAHRDVLLTLRTFRGTGGACWPSHETLAARAGCCVRTVQRALQQARELGLVTWSERRVRAGWRWLRTSNWYAFAIPREAVQPGQRVHKRKTAVLGQPTAGQQARGGDKLRKKEAIQQMIQEAAAAPDLLAMRRAAFAAGQVRRVS